MIKDGNQNNNSSNTLPLDTALAAFLQSELLILSNETRKKQPDAKLLIDGLLTKLRANQPIDHQLTTIIEQVSNGPCRSRCLPSLVSIILRLVTHSPTLFKTISPLLQTLLQAVCATSEKEGGGEDVHLKCLQCAIPIWQNFEHDDQVVFGLLAVCFKLCTVGGGGKESRQQQSVMNAAMAITRQLVIYLFESSRDQEQQQSQLIKVLNCISLWMHNERATLLESTDCTLQPSPSFCVELFESLLSGQHSITSQSQMTIALLREQVCPFVVRKLDDLHDFTLLVRLWRLVSVILSEYAVEMPLECEIFLSFMTRILEDRVESEGVVVRVLVLEAIDLVWQKGRPALDDLSGLSGNVNNGTSPALLDLIKSLFRFTLNEVTDISITPTIGKKQQLVYEQSCLRVTLLSSFERATPPATIPIHYPLFLSFRCLYSLTAILKNNNTDTTVSILSANGRVMAELVDRMCGLPLDKLWLSNAMDLFAQWLITCRQCPLALSATLSSLSMVGRNQGEMGKSAARCCIESAISINEALLLEDWAMVVSVIVGGSGEECGAVEKLLEACKSFTDPAHLAFQSAIVNMITSESKSVAEVLQRLCAANTTRYPTKGAKEAWLNLATGIDLLLEANITQTACEIASTVTINYFANLLPEAAHEDQVLGLHVLQVISPRPAASECVLDALHKVITLHGQGFGDDCWTVVYQVLTEQLDLPGTVRPVFNTTRLIGSDYHTKLSPRNLALHISLLGRLARHQENQDLNISLSAITSLWDCADAVVTKQWWPEWRLVLQELGRSGDDRRCEIRNGAVQTVFRMVQVHGKGLPKGDDWRVLFEDILNPLCELVDLEYGEVEEGVVISGTHHTRDTTKKQWDETMVFVMRGFSQIFIEHSSVIDVSIWRSVFVRRLVIMVKDTNRAELVSVAWQCILQVVECCLRSGEWSEKWEPLWTAVCLNGAMEGLRKNANCFDQSCLVNIMSVLKHYVIIYSDQVLGESIDPLFQLLHDLIVHQPTPSDRVHDRDHMNELQRTVIAFLTTDIHPHDNHKLRVAVIGMLARVLVEARPEEGVDLVTCLSSWSVRMRPQVLPSAGQASERDFTRVAFYLACFDYLTSRPTAWFEQDASVMTLWQSGSLRSLIDALTHWCGDLKYRAPKNTTKQPWIHCQNTFLSLLKKCNGTVLYKEEEFVRVQAESLSCILNTACRAVPVDIDPEQLELDESVDMEVVKFMEELIRDSQTTNTARSVLLSALSEASQLYHITTLNNVMTAPAVSLDDTERVVKGGLAAACLQSLFTIDHARPYLRARVTKAMDDFLSVQHRMGSIPAPQYLS